MAQLVKNLLAGRPRFDPWVGNVPCRREEQRTPVFLPGAWWAAVHGVTKSQTHLSNILVITQGPRGLGRRLQRGSALALPILSHPRYIQSTWLIDWCWPWLPGQATTTFESTLLAVKMVSVCLMHICLHASIHFRARNPLMWALLLISFYRERNCREGKQGGWSNLPEVTGQLSGSSGIWTQRVWFQSPGS